MHLSDFLKGETEKKNILRLKSNKERFRREKSIPLALRD